MFRQYLIDEIERYQDKESCEAFEQWCEEMEGLKEAEEHNKYYYK